ncbi:MAG: ADP-ribosylglycohydrolase family protein [Thermoflexibacter sp.]|nr:ADP-ribosylglycohydrolase family protein [Thermoflexibacter sp.]
MMTSLSPNPVLNGLIGLVVGDALGVPVEFKSRDYLKINPVRDMFGFGTYQQPAGTWSDDSSLAFCLADALCSGYDLQAIADWFVAWYDEKAWTPHGQVFDIGISTSAAINKLKKGVSYTLSGGNDESSNGNGSLMRILPLVFYIKNEPIERRYQMIKEVSSITHAHIRSVLSCFIYVEYALLLLQGKDKWEAYKKMQDIVNHFIKNNAIASETEINQFHRILENPINDYEVMPIYQCKESEVYSSGYVIYTLEASFWCLLKHENYPDTVLAAVNLGEDTDTTAAVVGGLAGILYGIDNIPEKWISQLARKEAIFDLAERLRKNCQI